MNFSYYTVANMNFFFFFEISGQSAKSIWDRLRNNHRDALRRQRNARRSGSPASIIKLWKYQKQMEFLLTFMNNRQRETNLEDNIDDSQTFMTDNEEFTDTLDIEKDEESFLLDESLQNSTQDPELIEIEAEASCYYASPKSNGKKSKKQDITALLKQSILSREKRAKERAAERKKIEESAAPKDDLYHFFMSMYEDTKSMPPAMQLQTKVIIFNEVSKKKAELLNVQLPHNPISSAPQHLDVEPQASTSSNNLVNFINNFVP